MQEKISRAAKMVINLAKGVRDYWWSQRTCILERQHRPIHCARSEWLLWARRLRENPSERSNHVDMQQRCSLLDKRLKEIEGVNDLGSVDPRELCLVPDLVILPNFKMPKFEKYDGTKCPENHLATYCNKMARHIHNEDLLSHVGGILRISRSSKINIWSTQIRQNSENWSVVTKSIKIKDQLGAVFVCLLL